MKTIRYTYLLCFLALGFVLTGKVQAQQDAMYTQYFANQLVINPAYAGSRDALSVLGLYRNQWVGFDGAPVSQTLTAHTPILGGRSNVGLSFIHDKIGISENLFLNASYAFRVDFGAWRLSMGLQGQISRRQMNWANSNPLDQGDPDIPFSRTNLFLPNVGAGLYIDSKSFYLGLAVPHILENELDFARNNNIQDLAQFRRHFFAMGGLVFDLSRDLKLRPGALVKFVNNAPTELDLNLGLFIKDKLLLGGTFRTGDSYDVFAQFWFTENLRLGYAYDFTFTQLSPYNTGSHEILLGIDLKKKRKGFDHPRYF